MSYIRIYRRTGNVCERLIIVNCEFFPDSQSLERKKLLLPVTTCTGCAAIAIIGNAISLFSLKRKHFTTHLKPVLRYIVFLNKHFLSTIFKQLSTKYQSIKIHSMVSTTCTSHTTSANHTTVRRTSHDQHTCHMTSTRVFT